MDQPITTIKICRLECFINNQLLPANKFNPLISFLAAQQTKHSNPIEVLLIKAQLTKAEYFIEGKSRSTC